MFLYYLIIAPIEMIVEWVFNIFIKSNIGGVITAITSVSIVINLLALPLYNIADSLQDKERQISRRLEPRLKRIRAAFKGDEQFMMISTYYRQNNYHPLYVLRSSLSILIEIPFFIAAYHYLSHCQFLLGKSFWIFNNLGTPDRMWTLKFGSLSFPINILPIMMTLINVISAAVYTKGGTIKEKIQIYALAGVFLALLYESPSGLVIYWILNNLFSLCKNVIQKMKHPKVILSYIIGIGLICICFILLFIYGEKGKISEKLIIGFIGVFFLLLPTLVDYLSKTQLFQKITNHWDTLFQVTKLDFSIFVFSALGLSILLGFLLPASIIGTSPTEFAFLGKTQSPFSYIHSTFWTFLGLCVFWPMCIWFMFNEKVKFVLSVLFPTFLICALCNAYLLAPDYGNLNAIFFLPESNRQMTVPSVYYLISLLVMIICFIGYGIARYFNKSSYISVLMFSLCLGMLALGGYKSSFISKEYNQHLQSLKRTELQSQKEIVPMYHLSKQHKNVVILFFDRALGIFVPKITQEFPQLLHQFSGFTYYPNTISAGKSTNTGAPSMVAGYEYTPDNINARKDELLVDKHNEACFVMPKLFLDAGFDVTITDMPLLNYMWAGDLTLYDKYPGIHGYNLLGNYLTDFYEDKNIFQSSDSGPDRDVLCRDKIRFFSLLQAIHPILRKRFYWASVGDMSVNAYGIDFLQSYSNLYFLPELTDFNNEKNTYTFITNNSTHEYINLKLPDYSVPANEYDIQNTNYTSAYISSDNEINQAYQVNTAALLQTAKWLDYLKANNVYDNTRIIIVADHGRALNIHELYSQFSGSNLSADNAAANHPLFMVKDFSSTGDLTTDWTFMTNADTIFFAIKDLPISDINPFTGKQLKQDKSNGIKIHYDYDWNAIIQKNRKTFTYNPNEGYIVRDNIFDPSNWTPITSGK